MADPNIKNKRSNNFCAEEEQLLLSLIAEQKDIIECKKTGAVSWKDKERAWKYVEEEFNCKNMKNIYRNIKVLKDKYANLKRTAKKKFSLNKQSMSKTGGGSEEKINFTPADFFIKSMLGEQIDGLSNDYDNDATTVVDTEKRLENSENDIEQNFEAVEINENLNNTSTMAAESQECNSIRVSTENSMENITNWGEYTSDKLKTKISKQLTAPSEKTKNSKSKVIVRSRTTKYTGLSYQLAQEKLDFIKIQKEKFLEEHEQRMILLKKKIELVNKKLGCDNIE